MKIPAFSLETPDRGRYVVTKGKIMTATIYHTTKGQLAVTKHICAAGSIIDTTDCELGMEPVFTTLLDDAEYELDS